jgi:hypothetical protein
MLNSTASLWIGVAFVLIGAVNVWLILQASARVRDTQASTRLIAAHRVGGYLFIALFCVMGYFMLARLGDAGGSPPPATMLHITLAMVLSPLLFVKVLVARYYKSYHSFLTPIGLTIFVLSFVLIGITAGPSLTHHARMQNVSLTAIDLPAADIDINMAASTMEKRCSKCHNLDRIVGAHKDTPGWLATVNRMKALPDSGISEEDARIIVSYLASQVGQKGSFAAASLEVARAVVDRAADAAIAWTASIRPPKRQGSGEPPSIEWSRLPRAAATHFSPARTNRSSVTCLPPKRPMPSISGRPRWRPLPPRAGAW